VCVVGTALGINEIACERGSPTGVTGSCGCDCDGTGYEDVMCATASACVIGTTPDINEIACENGAASGVTGGCGCDCDSAHKGALCGEDKTCAVDFTDCLNGGNPKGIWGSCACDCAGTGFEGEFCQVEEVATDAPTSAPNVDPLQEVRISETLTSTNNYAPSLSSAQICFQDGVRLCAAAELADDTPGATTMCAPSACNVTTVTTGTDGRRLTEQSVTTTINVQFLFPANTPASVIEEIQATAVSTAIGDPANSAMIQAFFSVAALETLAAMLASGDPATVALASSLDVTAFGDPTLATDVTSSNAAIEDISINPPSSTGLGPGAIAGIAVGAVGGLLALIGGAFLLTRNKSSSGPAGPTTLTPAADFDVENGVVSSNSSAMGRDLHDGGRGKSRQSSMNIADDLKNLEDNLTLGPLGAAAGAATAGAATGAKTETVFAPPGKLGVVVDSANDGPTVHSIRDSSPLLGIVSVGDKILSIDEIDCRAMSAGAVTKLMARKASQQERKIIFEKV
jgi:hypothetical protein